MGSEIERFKNRKFNVNGAQKAPAKMDPNVSQRRLSITCQNVGSFNSLFAIGNIRKEQGRDRTINFTTEQEGGPK